ncbi:MAG: hypothetical protein ABSD49_14975 [Candidatus Bathyarchaeia archaeon]
MQRFAIVALQCSDRIPTEQIEYKIREMLKSDFFSIEKVSVIQEDEPPLIIRPLTSTLSDI